MVVGGGGAGWRKKSRETTPTELTQRAELAIEAMSRRLEEDIEDYQSDVVPTRQPAA